MTNVTPVAPPVARAHVDVDVDVDGDTSGRRKFDSTTQEVHENLTDAGRITAIAACHARPHIDIEPERFRVRQWRQHLRSFADKRAEIKRNVFHHHAAGFRFRYIEDVVDQRQQPPGGIHDGAEAAGRIVVRPTVAQEFLMPEIALSGVCISRLIKARNTVSSGSHRPRLPAPRKLRAQPA
ncbi:hypothetical protein [Burkholderia ubonensis]|uniref:hypothetical protein n=1 Tax=Burkholderia ubonensis TaxID=101571 RepID=UPI0012FA1613|nr:hypothetical protein [Burkholderia ubonensis]